MTVRGTTETTNSALGGAPGKRGRQGAGCGGLYLDPSAAVAVDDFTVGHVTRNKAATSNADVYGSYTVV